MKSSIAAFFFSLSLISMLSILFLQPATAGEASRFYSCQSSVGRTMRYTPEACALDDEAAAGQMHVLAADLENSLNFQKRLEATVFSQIDSAISKYDKMSRCEPECEVEARDQALRLEKLRGGFRTELALMQPDDPAPQAMQGTRGWFSLKPKHPFAKSPSLVILDPAEGTAIKAEFLKRIAKFVPSVGARIDDINSGKDTLARSEAEFLQIQKAVLQVRAEARAKYLSYIGRDPLLIFVADDGSAIADRSVATAAANLRDEAKLEKTRLTNFTKQTERAEALIEYIGAVESVLQSDRRSCVAAERLAAQSDSTRKNKSRAVLAGQIGAGVLTAVVCGTGLGCAAGASLLAATDFAIASEDAKNSFRAGVTNTVIETPGTRAGKDAAMSQADTTASMRGATLAMSLPTLFSTGSAVVRATRSAFESTAAKAGASTIKGQFINEVVGAAPISKLNTLSQIFYKDVLESHTGREREVIETLIERMRKQGIEPAKISTTIKERVRQCAR